jgi:phospholipase D1/2
MPILRAGRNCEQIAQAEQAGVLVDARDYYRAVHRAISAARQYVLVAGWQFDSGFELLRGADAAPITQPTRLLELLEHVVEQRPELHVYLLAWDYSVVFALEREWLQKLKFDWTTNDRIRFKFDDQHPAGGSHHQKLVVVDGAIAFTGGIDLCDARWDDRAHALDNPLRVTMRGKPHKPYHDLMAFCTGPAVTDAERLFRLRWRRATGEELALTPPEARVPFDLDGMLPLSCTQVALCTTFGEHPASSTPKTEQIKALYEDAIAGAQELIYIETQYFTSNAVHHALTARMHAKGPKLAIVIVMPNAADTPKENFALGDAQNWVLFSLQATARAHGHALRILFSGATDAKGELVATFIHSKVLAVDDRILSIGSANCTNRSMSLDSELNLTWECSPADTRLAGDIARVRASLLAEHAGIAYDPALEQKAGLVARLDALIGSSKLQPREVPSSPADLERNPLLEWAFDPTDAVTELELDDLVAPLFVPNR